MATPNDQFEAANKTQSTLAYLITESSPDIAETMIVPTGDEFKKLPAERQTEELFILIQRLMPLTKRIDSMSDSVSALADRMNSIEAHQGSYKITKEYSNSFIVG